MLQERGVNIHLGDGGKRGWRRFRGAVRWKTNPYAHSDLGGRSAGLDVSANGGIRPGHGGRIDVQPDLTVPGFPQVYALGDYANISGEQGDILPQLASVAEQAGKWCAKQHMQPRSKAKPKKPFDYFDKGIMAMIGRSAAIAEVGAHRHELQGPIAFAAWIGVHAALLSTIRAKVEAFVEWAWDYFGKVKGDQVLDRFSQERHRLERRWRRRR